MKKAQSIIVNILIVVTFLFAASFNVSAAEEQTLEQIYAAGDYNIGSVYGPRLNRTELDQVAQAVLTFVESYDWTGMDDFTKVYYAHQYLCNICDYAPDWSQNRANTAWGALVYGEAQCSGYARAFKALCDAIGIGCYYVHADENAVNPSHQWNEVCVDGVWYIIDVQCNDSSGFPAVYLVSGETYACVFGMSWNHDGLPECTRDYGYEETEWDRTESETEQNTTCGTGESYSVDEYDEAGNKVKSTYYDTDGTILFIDEYGESGQYKKTIFYNEDGTVDFSVISEYEYKENWKREKSTYYHADGTVSFGILSEHAYDQNGNEIESVSYYTDGTFDSHIIRAYDGNQHEIRATYYNEDGTIAFYIIHEYDASGNCIRDGFYNENGTLDFYVIYEYDEAGKWLRSTYWNADQTMSMVIEF